MILLDVKNLNIKFSTNRSEKEAVRDISFHLNSEETLAIVGESGSGKSVSSLSLTRLLPKQPICKVSGEIFYKENTNSKNILDYTDKELRKIRGKEIAYIFQEPFSSLNPVFTIGYQIAEAVKLHFPEIKNVKECVINSLKDVGIFKPEERYYSYPHELSGGMQQRVMIAMALSCKPRILIADEPTTALDVTIQKQILDLLKDLQKRFGMSIILITHNFGIVKNFADRVIVMFNGKIVEEGSTKDVLENPKHPYTQALISCVPKLGQSKKRLTTIDYSKLDKIDCL